MQAARLLVLMLLSASLLAACGGGGDAPPAPPGTPTSHLVTLAWDANREADVNRAGGGYIVAINGQTPITLACPCAAARPSVTTTLMSGTYTATVTAYTAISKSTGLAGANSSTGVTIAINVPY